MLTKRRQKPPKMSGMKRDLPFSVEEDLGEETPRSMLASRTVWIGGVLSLAAWCLLAAWLLR